MSLSGWVCVVTGASRGIGKGIALQLSEAGATVYITGRSEKTLKQSAAEVKVCASAYTIIIYQVGRATAKASLFSVGGSKLLVQVEVAYKQRQNVGYPRNAIDINFYFFFFFFGLLALNVK